MMKIGSGKKMAFLLLTWVMSQFVQSCRPEKTERAAVTIEEGEARNPVWWKMADPECGVTEGSQVLEDMGMVSVWVAVYKNEREYEVRQLQYDLSGFSGNGLRNSSYLIDGFFPGGTVVHSPDKMSVEKLKLIQLCRRSYPRMSLENAALAVALGLKEGFRFAAEARADIPAKNLKVLIQPEFYRDRYEKAGHVVRTLQTDQAFWLEDRGENSLGYLVFAPHSVEGADEIHRIYPGHQVYFWEQPAVTVHELGHHIFSSMVRRMAIRPKRHQDHPDYYSGLNEGFSDLFSWLALQPSGQDGSLRPEGRLFLRDRYLRDSRHVPGRRLRYAGKTGVKAFNRKQMGQPDFLSHLVRDFHNIGSVFAHMVYRVLIDDSGEPTGNPGKLSETFSLLLDWLESGTMDEKNFSGPDQSGAMGNAMVEFSGLAAASLGVREREAACLKMDSALEFFNLHDRLVVCN